MDKCKHPEEQREPYHDMTVKCCACNCVIEQFGKPIDPPSPLSPKIWPVESPREPACSTTTEEKIDALWQMVWIQFMNESDGPEPILYHEQIFKREARKILSR